MDSLDQQDTVYALARSSHTLYAARASGLYRSQDEGLSWEDAFASQTVTALAAVGDRVFAGVNGAILRSEDAGENWHIAGLSSPPSLVVALAVSPNFDNDGVISAGTTEDGVFISSDWGSHWISWNFGLIDRHICALAISPGFSDDRTLFAGTESGIFCSHNGGRGWRELSFPMDAAPVLSLAVSPNYVTDGRMYAGTENDGLFVSDDFGINWRQHNDSLISTAVNAIQINGDPTLGVCLLLEDRLLWSASANDLWQQHPFPPGKSAMTMLLYPTLVGFADGDLLLVP